MARRSVSTCDRPQHDAALLERVGERAVRQRG